LGTRWKNRIVLLICLLFFSYGVSGLFTLMVHGNSYVYKDYYHSPEFQGAFDEFASYLGLFNLYAMPIEEAKEAISVSEEEIKEHRYRYGSLEGQIANIKSQYEGRILEAQEAEDEEALNNFTAERDAKIADITKNFESDDYVKGKIIIEKEQKLEELYEELERKRPLFEEYKKSFSYSLTSPNEKVIESENWKDLSSDDFRYKTNLTVSRDYAIHYGTYDYKYTELLDSVTPNSIGPYNGQIGLAKSLPASNKYVVAAEHYKQKRVIFYIFVGSSGLALLLSLVIGKKSRGIRDEVKRLHPFYNKLPIDVRVILFLLAMIAACTNLFIIIDGYQYAVNGNYYDAIEIVFCIGIGAILWGVSFIQALFIASEMKDWETVKVQCQKALLYKLFLIVKEVYVDSMETIEEAFYDRSTATQVFLILLTLFGLGLAVIIITLHPAFFLVYLILLAVLGYPIVMRITNKIAYFNSIVETTNDLAAGRLGTDLKTSGNSALSTLANNINQLKQGVKTSQNEQAKSERLKTELITNVSHDLRTPLTSIINYTELLKNTEVSLEERKSYINIIDKKSKRLKVLIDDLFEVSKMASGNIELQKEEVDIVQLLQQALAEYDTDIRESTVQFRITNSNSPVLAYVDGQKLWRVFDNLIGNIIKYSLEQSRAYITVETKNKETVITFKNVSKYELSENSEELFERFKRGDTSRQTEGSGLGLAIAQSIIDLHAGRLSILVDGDLFKVSITLPKENKT
jgi:signal transduction histidine kinase